MTLAEAANRDRPACGVAVPVRLEGSRSAAGVRQPVTFGVPLPAGAARVETAWAMTRGNHVLPVQAKPLATWPDGSVKWLQIAMVCEATNEPINAWILQPLEAQTERGLNERGRSPLAVLGGDGAATIAIEALRLRVTRGEDCLFGELAGDARRWLGAGGCQLTCRDAKGIWSIARIESVVVCDAGPLCARVAIAGRLGRRTGLRFSGNLSIFAGLNLVRLELTVHNPRRAHHPNGYWDLGDAGSIYLEELSLELSLAPGSQRQISWRENPAEALQTTNGEFLEIRQLSSGGDHWHSPTHVNREGRIPLRQRGYRVRTREGVTHGLRASPYISVADPQRYVTCVPEEFWQKFPTSVVVENDRLLVGLWPRLEDDVHELQGGEQVTRIVWFAFGEGAAPPGELAWVHDPWVAVVDAGWIHHTAAVPYFAPPATHPRREFCEIARAALEGEHSLFAKRETIDEYGWRHYGDVWADHEEAYSEDPRPVISHYNNQYDLLYGLLVQFLQTGDVRWWRLADPLARHVIDIDIYHTDRDKPAYNGGLFWHTAHYHDAATCTHRAMSRAMRGKRIPAPGGGPANEHNYASGLLLYYWLTGNELARDAVVGLADWVLAMDDGRRHVLGVLSDRPTGFATGTTVMDYHGPGRGAGNSLRVLLDAWLAVGSEKYLAKAVELMRRTIHPQDDIAARELHNAELRWSYTVYLQALDRFLDVTRDRADLATMREYACASLLAYARWMADHEQFYLDRPEQLEYPTETWAAQELRKGTTLWMAARYAEGEERERFLRRGQEILDRAWERLMSFASRCATRPVAIVLQQGPIETYFAASRQGGQGDAQADFAPPVSTHAWPTRETFVRQKQCVRELARSPRAALGSLRHAVRPARWANLFRQTWMAERCRRWFEGLRSP